MVEQGAGHLLFAIVPVGLDPGELCTKQEQARIRSLSFLMAGDVNDGAERPSLVVGNPGRGQPHGHGLAQNDRKGDLAAIRSPFEEQLFRR